MTYEVCDVTTNKSLGLISFELDLLPALEAFASLSGSIYLVEQTDSKDAVHLPSLDAFMLWLRDA
jgi:hypothetical protein